MWRNKFMPSYGWSTTTRKWLESRPRLGLRKIKLSRLLIFSLGRTIPGGRTRRLKTKRDKESRKCFKTSGIRSSKPIKRPRDKNSFWTEREILNWLIIMPPRESLEIYKLRLRSRETRSCSMLLSPERRHFKISKTRRELREEERSLNFNNIINKLRVIRKLTRNSSTNSCSKRPRDSIKWEKLSGRENNKLESTFWEMSTTPGRRMSSSNNNRRRN